MPQSDPFRPTCSSLKTAGQLSKQNILRRRESSTLITLTFARFAELSKRLGEKWKGMTDEEKKPYQDQAAADKVRYEQQLAAYNGK